MEVNGKGADLIVFESTSMEDICSVEPLQSVAALVGSPYMILGLSHNSLAVTYGRISDTTPDANHHILSLNVEKNGGNMGEAVFCTSELGLLSIVTHCSAKPMSVCCRLVSDRSTDHSKPLRHFAPITYINLMLHILDYRRRKCVLVEQQ